MQKKVEPWIYGFDPKTIRQEEVIAQTSVAKK